MSEFLPRKEIDFNRTLRNVERFCQNFLKIEAFGSKALKPFHLNTAQQIIHSLVQDQLRQQGKVRAVILKARRQGISTYIQGRFFHHTVTRRNKNTHTVAHDDKTNDILFRIAKLFEEYYPEELKPMKRYSGKKELVFADPEEKGRGLNSYYTFSSAAGNPPVGSGIDYLHCSEVSRWNRQSVDDFINAMLNCVVNGHGTEVFLESTACGLGGVFHERWEQAQHPSSEYLPIFLSWYLFDEYKKPFASEEKKFQFLRSLGLPSRGGDEEEEHLLGHRTNYVLRGKPVSYELTLEHLHWRREKIHGSCGGEVMIFHQDFPTVAQEAFISSARSAFPTPTLNRVFSILKSAQAPSRYHVKLSDRIPTQGKTEYLAEQSETGNLLIWSHPSKSRSYVIGADVAEGLEIGKDSDYSCAYVLDRQNFEMCACWHGRIDPDKFAQVLTTLGRYYSKSSELSDCVIGVESNNHGLTTLKFLTEVHRYPTVHHEVLPNQFGNEPTKRLGWRTTSISKPLMIDFLNRIIRDDALEKPYLLKDSKLVEECLSYVIEPNGAMNSLAGKHDDRVIAWAIACQMVRMYPHFTDKPIPQVSMSF